MPDSSGAGGVGVFLAPPFTPLLPGEFLSRGGQQELVCRVGSLSSEAMEDGP